MYVDVTGFTYSQYAHAHTECARVTFDIRASHNDAYVSVSTLMCEGLASASCQAAWPLRARA